jgi:hypothetical protein
MAWTSSSRGTTVPLGSSTGVVSARPSAVRRVSLSMNAAAKPTLNDTDRIPRSAKCSGKVAISECSVCPTRTRPTGGGKSSSSCSLMAGTSTSRPSRKVIAGTANSSRIVWMA